MYSVESEEKFEKHLKELSEMSPEQERRLAARMDKSAMTEREFDPLRAGDVLASKGVTGVHRADLVM